MTSLVHDHGVELLPDLDRVVARLHLPGETIGPYQPRAEIIAARVRALADDVADKLAARTLADFASRHHDLPAILDEHAATVLARIGESMPEGSAHRAVLGATFTAEYTIEGAAMCNPSTVLHPDQSGLKPGQVRVAISLREIGEGHVSSIGFCSAVIGPDRTWTFEKRALPLRTPLVTHSGSDGAHYQSAFPPDSTLSQRVLQPTIPAERNGLEDLRLVRFVDDDGTVEYRGTYTAYDGVTVIPRLLTSSDLVSFVSHPLTGAAAVNKGVALFPRRVGGSLIALVRSDGETNSLADSPDGLAWGREHPIVPPMYPWELVQSGNCGSPVETPEGWLTLTHGVGPMRVYSLGAMLLDLDDPSVVRAALTEPLVQPVGAAQPGYVPNVVYTCGMFAHEGVLWMPYGVGDNRIRVASIEIAELLARMTKV
jgi:predicted GH43/DUF377 family glycosyl hydrolase